MAGPIENLAPAFKPGQSGNPGGKAVGTRDRLTKRFLYDLAADFDEHGKAALKACREANPAAYIRAIAGLMPKEIAITRPLEGITDDELNVIAERLRSAINLAEDRAGDSPPSQVQAAH